MAEVEVCRFDEHSGECRWIACPNLVPGSPTGCPLPWPREQIDRLRSVALAARALVQSANNRLAADEVSVDEPALTALERALADAGLDLTPEEFERGVADETKAVRFPDNATLRRQIESDPDDDPSAGGGPP